MQQQVIYKKTRVGSIKKCSGLFQLQALICEEGEIGLGLIAPRRARVNKRTRAISVTPLKLQSS